MSRGRLPATSLFLLLLAVVFRFVHNSLTTRPLNVVVISNSSFRLNCSTNLTATPVQWFRGADSFYYSFAWTTLTTFYKERFTINDSSSSYDLIAATSDNSYCGSYTCIDNNGIGDEATANVTIYDSAPRCTSNSTGPLLSSDTISFYCTVGLLSPNCSVYNPPLLNLEASNGTILTSGNITSVSWTETVGYANSSSIRCVISSTIQSACPTVSVGIKPYNVSTNDIQCSVGDTLTCSAGGYPFPEYEWHVFVSNLTYNLTTDGAALTLDSSMLGYNLTFQCTAFNNINGARYSNTKNVSCYVKPQPSTSTSLVALPATSTSSSGVTTKPTDAPSQQTVAIIAGVVGGVGGALLILLIVVLLVCCVRRRKSKQSDHKSGGQANSHDKSPTKVTNSQVHAHENPSKKAARAKANTPMYTEVKKTGKGMELENTDFSSGENAEPAYAEVTLNETSSANVQPIQNGDDSNAYADIQTTCVNPPPKPKRATSHIDDNNASAYASIDHTLRAS